MNMTMNIHIKLGNEALQSGDFEIAKKEFYLALGDPNELNRRIAQNRLTNRVISANSVGELARRPLSPRQLFGKKYDVRGTGRHVP